MCYDRCLHMLKCWVSSNTNIELEMYPNTSSVYNTMLISTHIMFPVGHAVTHYTFNVTRYKLEMRYVSVKLPADHTT